MAKKPKKRKRRIQAALELAKTALEVARLALALLKELF